MPTAVEDEATDAVSVVSRRFTALTVAALVLLVLTIVLLAIALTLPWWVFFDNGAMWSYYLATSCRVGICQNYQATPTLGAVFGLTYALIVGSLVAFVIALGISIASITRPKLGVLSLALGLIGSLLVAAAPLYLYFALPGAVTSTGNPVPIAGFFGSSALPGGGGSYSWTGAAGWFFAWLILPIAVAATAAAHRSAKHRATEERALESLRSLARHTSDLPSLLEPEPKALQEEVPERFCPLCGLRYPATEEFCSNDFAPLKDVVP